MSETIAKHTICALKNLTINTSKTAHVFSEPSKANIVNMNADGNAQNGAAAGAGAGAGLLGDILHQFQQVHDRRTKKKTANQPASNTDGNNAAEPTPSTSAATADEAPQPTMAEVLRRRNMVMVYQTHYTKQPLTGNNLAYVRRTMKQLLLARILFADADNQGDPGANVDEDMADLPPVGINWTTGNLDPDTRGLALIPDDQASRTWIQSHVLTLTNEGTQFRAWALDENPAEYCYEMYLSEDYNCMEQDQVFTLLHRLNPGIPTDDYSVEQVTDMADKRDYNKGRLFRLKTGAVFHEYCKSRSFNLKYAGDMIQCIEAEEKQRQANKKKAAAAATASRNQGNGRPPTSGGYGAGFKKPRN
jgi:hypothetical protein